LISKLKEMIMGGDDPIETLAKPIEWAVDEVARPVVDTVTGKASRQRKKAEQRASKKAEEKRKKQLKARRTREKTEEKIKETESSRSQRRSRQKRASRSGRTGTILTDSLGKGGGNSDDKKTLLGT
jgi:hypothetical protein